MMKHYAVFSLCLILFAGGCGETKRPGSVTHESAGRTYESELFTLQLPSDFTADNGLIRPSDGGMFPNILFGSAETTSTIDVLLDQEKRTFMTLCEQTGQCGEIINPEHVIINGKNALKFTVRYLGRSVEDRSGFIEEYHYSILTGGKVVAFWSSGTDMHDLGSIKKQFQDIVETVQMK